MLVDAENVRRSTWPNVSRDELERRTDEWARARRTAVVVVWEGATTADDVIAALAAALADAGQPYWLATSDRGLRQRASAAAERVIGGGRFLRELLGER